MPDGGTRIAGRPEHPDVTLLRWAEEKKRRLECRRSFLAWCIEALAPFGQTPAAHHRLLISELQAVADGLVDRLMIFMPPGSAKSRYATVLFAAWLLSRRPDYKLIGASHTSELADDFSGKIQGFITENATTLGYDLATRAQGRWYTTTGGAYLAAGVRAGIPGYRADCAIIDDPVKGRAAADSGPDRKQVWDWYNGDLERRLTPKSAVILMMTRWHEDDLAGRLLATEAHRWRVLKLPAEAEENDPLGRTVGEWLWSDDGYGFGHGLAQIKQSLSERAASREWTAQYQQRPVPDTGSYFLRDWLRSVPTLPPRSSMRVFMGSDYAVTDSAGDYTCHAVVGIDSDDRMYLLDIWRFQTTSDEWCNAFCDLVLKWRPMGAAEEMGQIRSAIGPWLDRKQRERRAFVARSQFPTRGDKSVRAQSIRGRMAAGGLYIPFDAPWRADFEAELLSFPAGKFDDQVDSIGLVGQLLDVMLPPPGPKPPAPPTDSWDRAFGRSSDDGGDSWKVA
jgi:predicted phage terminase large subunit-like protein